MNQPLANVKVQMLLDNPCAPDWRVEREAGALWEAGADVAILCWDRDGTLPRTERRGGVAIERIPTPAARNRGLRQLVTLARFYRRAWRRLRNEQVTLYHVHDLPLLPLAVVLARRRVPLVYDAHEIYHIMEATKYPAPLRKMIAAVESWLIRRHVNVLVTVSRQRVDEYWRRVVGDTPIAVVGNWYDPVEPDQTRRDAACASLGLRPVRPCIVYAGGLALERRLDLFVEAARARPEVQFLVAGRGAPAIEQMLTEATHSLPNLRYAGWTSRPDDLYRSATALYYVLDPGHPYSHFAASNTLYIAVAHGLPVITCRVGEPGALMIQIDQRLAMPSATLDDLLSAVDAVADSTQARAIGTAMTALQGRYSWALSRAALLEAYQALLRDAGASGHPSPAPAAS